VPEATPDASAPTITLLDRYGPDSVTPPPTLEQSLAYVRGLAASHYENFSVLSRLVPPNLRDDFAAVYAFCRWADDLGDETGATPEARLRSLELLAWWRRGLRACLDPALPASHPVYIALSRTIRERHLPLQPFEDLISAFEQDQRIRVYRTWDEVVGYCRLSANPVGRIVLALGGYPDNPQNSARYSMSDATCTALQLTNHWQDVRRDLLDRGRVYMPVEETGIGAETLAEWANRGEDPAVRVPFIKALRPLVERTWGLFREGDPLPGKLNSNLRPVVWLFGAGGKAVLRGVERTGCATLWTRPTLSPARKAMLLGCAWLLTRLASRSRTGQSGAGNP
jgi:squalene synthase HpnC